MYEKRTDDDLAAEVTCYGKFWDPEHPDCIGCFVQARCVPFMGRVTLPNAAKDLGRSLASISNVELGEHLQIPPKAAAWLRRVHEEPELGLPERDANGRLVPKDVSGSERDVEEELKLKPEPTPKPRKQKKPPKKKTETKRNPSRARAAKGQPTRAVSVTKRKEPQRSKKVEDRRKGRKQNSDSPKKTVKHHWGTHTYARRWTTERATSPLIARIPIGGLLRRWWEGSWRDVRCKEGYWAYEEKRFPTLHSVVEAITGTKDYPAQIRGGKRPKGTRKMTAWSARKFFQLDPKLRELGLHPDQEVTARASSSTSPRTSLNKQTGDLSRRSSKRPKVRRSISSLRGR